MEREKLKSANLHSVGYDSTGMEVQFHAKACKGMPCTCEGGTVYHYPEATAADHAALIMAKSPGSFFHAHIREKLKGVKV